MSSLRLLTLAAAVFLLTGVVFSAFAQSPNLTVTVTGTGPSVDEARMDAVHQALQQTLKQLVVVDRAISGDRLLRDKVMSTMNGYVERFNQRSLTDSGGILHLEADITVSSSRIENFVGVTAAAGGTFEGPLLSREQSRRLAQAQAKAGQAMARGEIFDRLMRGFPSAAIDITLRRMELSDDDPDVIVAQVGIAFKETFVKALEGTVRAFALFPCVKVALNWQTVVPLTQRAARLADQRECQDRKQPGTSYVFPERVHDTVCFRDSRGDRCFAVAAGEFCASCLSKNWAYAAKDLVLFVRFLDAAGQSAMKGESCVATAAQLVDIQYDTDQAFVKESQFMVDLHKFETRRLIGFDLRPRQARLHISTSALDLGRAASMAAVAGVRGRRSGVLDIGPDAEQDQDGCAYLEEAIQRRRITQ